MVQRLKGAKSRQVTEPHDRILREALFQIIRECLSQGRIHREDEGQGSAILRIPAIGKVVCRHRDPSCLLRITEKALPHCCSGFVLSRTFPMACLPRQVDRAP